MSIGPIIDDLDRSKLHLLNFFLKTFIDNGSFLAIEIKPNSILHLYFKVFVFSATSTPRHGNKLLQSLHLLCDLDSSCHLFRGSGWSPVVQPRLPSSVAVTKLPPRREPHSLFYSCNLISSRPTSTASTSFQIRRFHLQMQRISCRGSQSVICQRNEPNPLKSLRSDLIVEHTQSDKQLKLHLFLIWSFLFCLFLISVSNYQRSAPTLNMQLNTYKLEKNS